MSPDPQTTSPPTPPTHCDRIEPIVWLLFGGTVLFAAGTVAIALLANTDGQTFQFLSNLASGFAGALLGIITGRKIAAGPTGKPNA